jgi:hypothetical protein
MTETTNGVRVFSNGCQSADWDDRNCCRCKKWNPDGKSECDIANALTVAYWDDGTVGKPIADRMGFVSLDEAYTWDCPERETIDEPATP